MRPGLSTSARLQRLPTLATVGAESASIAAPSGSGAAARFASAEQLLAAEIPVDGIVVAPRDPAEAHHWLTALRRSPRLGAKPIWLTAPCGAVADALSDGVAGGRDDLLERAAAMRERWDALHEPEAADGDHRLLQFLFLRPQYVLKPIADWHDARLYYYPLADLFSRDGEEGFALLSRLRQRGWLEATTLAERVHVCARCGSAHLVFAERCPQCGGIDIAQVNFLHCYACGNVAPEDDYLHREGLTCPKCAVRLRHIGVDYDRALETSGCKACGARFTDPHVRARCACCREECESDDLAERRLFELELTPSGEHAARSGSTGDLFVLVDALSGSHPSYFEQTLEWLLALGRRHGEVAFGLIAIRFSNLSPLANECTRNRAAQLLDAFAQRLHEPVRATDLFMRDDEEWCWLLLPQTGAAAHRAHAGRSRRPVRPAADDGGARSHAR